MDTTLTEAPAPKKKAVRRKKRKPYASKAPMVKKVALPAVVIPEGEKEACLIPGEKDTILQVTSIPPQPITEANLGTCFSTNPPTFTPPADDPARHMAAQMGAIQEGNALTTLPPCIPVIPYWSAMWKPCADAFASNVDCVIVINVPPQKKELGFWRSAVKTIKANQEAETQSRERKGKPPVQVRLVGYLSPHHDEATTRSQMRRYEQELQIREFWADGRKRGPNILDCDHYGDEHTPLPATIAQEGTLRVGYATNKTWRAEWEKARQTGRYVAMLEDVSMLMPPNWWRDWLRSQLTK